MCFIITYSQKSNEVILSPIYRWRKWSPGKFSNLPKITHPTIGRAKIWTLALETEPVSPPYINNSFFFYQKVSNSLLTCYGKSKAKSSSSLILPMSPLSHLSQEKKRKRPGIYIPSKPGKCVEKFTLENAPKHAFSRGAKFIWGAKTSHIVMVCGPPKLNATQQNLISQNITYLIREILNLV